MDNDTQQQPKPDFQLSPEIIKGLLDRKMENEKNEYLKETGKFQAKLKVMRYWRAVFEAGGRGEDPPKMEDTGIPYLVLQMFHPTGNKAKRWFEVARAALPDERKEELLNESAIRGRERMKKAREEEAKNRKVFTPLDEQVRGLVHPDKLATMSYEQKEALALAAQRMGKKIELA